MDFLIPEDRPESAVQNPKLGYAWYLCNNFMYTFYQLFGNTIGVRKIPGAKLTAIHITLNKELFDE